VVLGNPAGRGRTPAHTPEYGVVATQRPPVGAEPGGTGSLSHADRRPRPARSNRFDPVDLIDLTDLIETLQPLEPGPS